MDKKKNCCNWPWVCRSSLAIEFNKNFSTLGFDLDKVRIDELNNQ